MKYDSYLRGIRSKYPKLVIEKFEAVEHGQNNIIIIINDQLVFRFPRNKLNKEVLIREFTVLSKIRDQLPLAVPNFQYFSVNQLLETSFVGYKFIEGEIMTQAVFATKSHEVIGQQLSSFLTKLHSDNIYNQLKDDLEYFDGYGVWKDMFQRIEGKLYPFMKAEVKCTITQDFQSILEALEHVSFKRKVVHGDFGPTNILVDRKSSQINGIIDFGSIHIGDPAEDIACLLGPFGYGIDFIKNDFGAYRDIESLINRAVLYTKSFALQEALYGIENNDQRAFDAGMISYI